MGTSADKEPPLYVPTEFEALHLDEARREVIRSCMERKHAHSRWDRLRGASRRWTVAVAAHIMAATVALVFTALTRTWLAGITVLVAVAASLGVTLLVLNWIEASDRPDQPA